MRNFRYRSAGGCQAFFLHLLPTSPGTEVKWSGNHSVVSDSLWPHGLYSPWNSPGQNTGVSCLFLLQGIFPIQVWNPDLPHCRQILYQLSYKRGPRILEWVAYPFSTRSSQPRTGTCIAGRFCTNWAMREARQGLGVLSDAPLASICCPRLDSSAELPYLVFLQRDLSTRLSPHQNQVAGSPHPANLKAALGQSRYPSEETLHEKTASRSRATATAVAQPYSLPHWGSAPQSSMPAAVTAHAQQKVTCDWHRGCF